MNERIEFVYLFDVRDGNPNGDPDAGNLPRTDPETGHGLVTDVCLKRKIRNYVAVSRRDETHYKIYIREKAVLNDFHEGAWDAVKPKTQIGNDRKKLPKDEKEAANLTLWMCEQFFDIRTFGAVMSTGTNCGQVRGPVQFGFARSIEPIASFDQAITRCAVTNEKDVDKERTIGRKYIVPYGLYRVHGFINAHLAAQTKFDENGEDLKLFFEALERMFDVDRSASRGEMAPRRLIVFKHSSPLGNAPAHKLFERVTVRRRPGDGPARSFADYAVEIDTTDLPQGITIEERI